MKREQEFSCFAIFDLLATSSSPLSFNAATSSVHEHLLIHDLIGSHSMTFKHIGQVVSSDIKTIYKYKLTELN